MNSVAGWILGVGFFAIAMRLLLLRKWLLAGLPLGIAVIAFSMLYGSIGPKNMDTSLNALIVLFCILFPGIYPWTNEGRKHAEAAHLSVEAAKVLGGLFLLLGLIGMVGVVLSAYGF